MRHYFASLVTVFFIGLFTQSIQANDIVDSPSYKNFKSNGKKHIFPDFKTAEYTILYDLQAKKAYYNAKINFDINTSGFTLFDIVSAPVSVSLNGQKVDAKKVSHKRFKAMYLDKKLKSGSHEMEISGEIKKLVNFSKSGQVSSAFWLSDLSDRNFLERFMPSSFEYDRVKMNFSIKLKGATVEHKIFTNGDVTNISEKEFSVSFPDFYTSSSLFYHLVPKNRVHEEISTLKSIDGRDLPITIYYTLRAGQLASDKETHVLNDYMETTKKSIKDLEGRFGAFLHNKMVVYATDGGGHSNLGGMEYCGATITNRGALNHEIIHSYFGRGIIPANGNAGWIDEAITTWADDTNYRTLNTRYFVNPRNLYGSSDYTRITHTGAYSKGMRFMGGLASYLELKGEKPFTMFLQDIIENHKYTPYTNQDFWNWSKNFYGLSFLEMLEKVSAPVERFNFVEIPNVISSFTEVSESHDTHSVHKNITLDQLRDLL